MQRNKKKSFSGAMAPKAPKSNEDALTAFLDNVVADSEPKLSVVEEELKPVAEKAKPSTIGKPKQKTASRKSAEAAPEKRQCTFYLPKELWKQMRYHCIDTDTDMSSFVAKLVAKEMKRIG